MALDLERDDLLVVGDRRIEQAGELLVNIALRERQLDERLAIATSSANAGARSTRSSFASCSSYEGWSSGLPWRLGVAKRPRPKGGHRMRLHGNARSCPLSRRLLVERVECEGWWVSEMATTLTGSWGPPLPPQARPRQAECVRWKGYAPSPTNATRTLGVARTSGTPNA